MANTPIFSITSDGISLSARPTFANNVAFDTGNIQTAGAAPIVDPVFTNNATVTNTLILSTAMFGNVAVTGAGMQIQFGANSTSAIGFELGSTTTATTPFIDFHSSGFVNDWDARIIASGGSNTGSSSANLTFYATNFIFNNPITVPGLSATNITATGGTGQFTWQDRANTAANTAVMYYSGGMMRFWLNGNDRAVIDTAGSFTAYGNITAQGNMAVTKTNPNLTISGAGDATLYLKSTDILSTNFGTKIIYSSPNDGNSGSGWLFRAQRTSDNAYFDYRLAPLAAGASATIWTSANFNPANYASNSSNNTITGVTEYRSVVSANGSYIQTGSFANNAGGQAFLEVKAYYNASTGAGPAFMQFHRPNNYAAYFGLDYDNVWKVGGWSAGNVAYTLWHSGNFTPGNYIPYKSMTGMTYEVLNANTLLTVGDSRFVNMGGVNNWPSSAAMGHYYGFGGGDNPGRGAQMAIATVAGTTGDALYYRINAGTTQDTFNPWRTVVSNNNANLSVSITSTDTSFAGTPLSLKRPNGQLVLQDGANTSNQWMLNSYSDGTLYFQAYGNGAFTSNMMWMTRGGILTVPALVSTQQSYIYGASGTIKIEDRANTANQFQIYNNQQTLRFYTPSGDRMTIDNSGNQWNAGSQIYLNTYGVGLGGYCATGFYSDGTNVGLRTYGNNAIYFQNVSGGITYGYWDKTNLNLNTGLYLAGGGIATNGGAISNKTGSGNGLVLQNGDSGHSGYIEFWSPGNTTNRVGYIGYGNVGGAINLSAELSPFSFVGTYATPNVNGSTMWHNGNVTFNTLGSGYIKFPNGWILQWGYRNNGQVDDGFALPIAFPNAVYGAFANIWADVSGSPSLAWSTIAYVVNNNYLKVSKRYINSGGGVGVAGEPYVWMAIGY